MSLSFGKIWILTIVSESDAAGKFYSLRTILFAMHCNVPYWFRCFCKVPFKIHYKKVHNAMHRCEPAFTDFRDPFAQLANCHKPIFKHFMFLLYFCNCFDRNQMLTRTLFVMDVCMSVHELFWHPYTVIHRLRITDYNVNGGSALGTQKIDHWTQLAHGGRNEGELHRERLPSQDWASLRARFYGDLKGRGKLHASVAGSCLKHSSRLQHPGDLILRTRLVVTLFLYGNAVLKIQFHEMLEQTPHAWLASKQETGFSQWVCVCPCNLL